MATIDEIRDAIEAIAGSSPKVVPNFEAAFGHYCATVVAFDGRRLCTHHASPLNGHSERAALVSLLAECLHRYDALDHYTPITWQYDDGVVNYLISLVPQAQAYMAARALGATP